ncbi:MAG: Crp/Fnr family transcriptional regulator [Rhizobiaceae bacterium]|nr:Crp/Fnr family transcriptional regulator [Rhizobiaceae bacterium]
MAAISPQAVFIEKLAAIFPLGAAERTALENVPVKVVELRRGQDVVRQGDRPTRCCILFEGFACWSKVTKEANRQILGIHIPGDLPDLHSLHLSFMDSTLTAMTTCSVGYVKHEVVRDLCDRYPGIARALWRSTLVDGAIFREWVANIGGRQAYQRIGHLLCEIFVRLSAVGRVVDGRCRLPFTQSELAEAAGLSIVHVNRTLQEWRKQGLIELLSGQLTIPDLAAACEAADFDPSYLHFKDG